MSYDHVLLVGFGGPEKKEDVIPFIKKVAQGRNIPEARLKEVEHHYELIGGKSPYNAQVFEFQKKLEEKLKPDCALPVFVGMRNWHPFMESTALEVRRKGLSRGIAFILSPFRSQTSCFRYKQDVENALKALESSHIKYDYIQPWCDDPLYLEAQVELVGTMISSAQPNHVFFTAHSIPQEMLSTCSECRYDEEFKTTSAKVAKKLGLRHWHTVYQSRSGNPRQPWLSPEIGDVLKEIPQGESVTCVPIGFICENAEILYDLDVEVKAIADERNLIFTRAATILNHPKFVEMVSKKILMFLK